MRNKAGVPVEGDDFYGRNSELLFVWNELKNEMNFKLPSPRRVGKTSFARKLCEMARHEGWKTFELNLEGCRTEEQFLDRFGREIRQAQDQKGSEKFFSHIKDIAKGVDFDVDVPGIGRLAMTGTQAKHDLYNVCLAALDDLGCCLIFLDELAEFLMHLTTSETDSGDAKEFLHRFREMRERPGSKTRWIVASSIGIDHFAERYGLSATLNNLTDYRLKPFDRESMKAMLMAIEQGSGVELDEAMRDALLDRAGVEVPYFVQLLFQKVRALHSGHGRTLNLALIEEAYQQLIAGSELSTWVERLETGYRETELKAALYILLTLSRGPATVVSLISGYPDTDVDVTKRTSVMNTVLRALTRDGYLMTDSNSSYRFRSGLLRAYWANKTIG